MTELVLHLDSSPSQEAKDLLERLLYWVAPGVQDVRVVEEARVLVDYTGALPTDELTTAMRSAISEILVSGEQFPTVVRHETGVRLANPPTDDPFPELVRRGWVNEEARGSFTYTDTMAELFEALDRLFVDRIGRFRPRRIHLPTLLAPATLLRSGSLPGSPHTANYVFHLHEGRSVPAQFAAQCVDADRGALNLGSLNTSGSTPDAVLSTAACQPCYRALRQRTLTTPELLTGRATCYRYESGATEGLRRLREFSVRELVCVGTPEQVSRVRERMLATAEDIMRDTGLRGRIMTASDPFFIDTASRMRMYQLSFEVKHELLARLPFDGSELAVGSVNHHEDHFGRTWEIRTEDGEWAHSCCLGLGLDRCSYAVFAQYGLDPDSWPAALRPTGGGADAW